MKKDFLMTKKWSKLEEAEDILDQCLSILDQIPITDLRNDHVWIPSREFLSSIAETRDRVYRYMKRNHLIYDNHNGNGH